MGIIWRADPRDVANRQEVVRFDDEEIALAILSPNGQLVALTTAQWDRQARPLWVVNLDGTSLRQLTPTAEQVLWAQNNRAIFYTLGEIGSPGKLAAMSPQTGGWVGVERVDLTTGKVQRILTIEPNSPLLLLGWSTEGQWLYYVLRNQNTYEFELWKVHQDGNTPQFIVSLGLNLPESSQILLSPNGGKLLLGPRWISTSAQERGDVPLPVLDQRWTQVLWDQGENEVIVGQYDTSQPAYHLYTTNLQSQLVREITTIAGGSIWEVLGLSPDYQWLMASPLYQAGFCWIHLPTQTTIPIPVCRDCAAHFVGWLSSETGR